MHENSENSWWLGAFLILMGASFLAFGGTIRGCSIEKEYSNVARRTQQCQVFGQQLHCQQHTSWWDGEECSCSINNQTRIRFNLPD